MNSDLIDVTSSAAVQVALKAAQKQLAAAPPPETMHRLGELEGALNQAMDDYQLLLKELGKVQQVMVQKGEEVADRELEVQGLQAQLQHALQEAAQYRCAVIACHSKRHGHERRLSW